MLPRARRLATAFVSAILLGLVPAAAGAQVRISQIYTPGGGGGGGAGYANSYIELHNNGSTTVSLAGWSIQYASQGGAWGMTPLSGSIAPGQFYLIRQGNNTAGDPLPGWDATGNSYMVPASGKLALVSSLDEANGCANGVPLVDFVGYGSLGCFEGSAAAPGMSPTMALFRKANGCQDTDDNLNDFELGTPNARWTASALAPCTAPPSGVGAATPGAIPAEGTTLFTVTVTPGINPPSTGLFVTGDLTTIGGGAAEPLYDDATHGDVTAGDNVFSLAFSPPLVTVPAGYVIAFTIGEAEGRPANANASLTVLPPVVISQIYTPGGSGGMGQGYNHSYVELHNRGPHFASVAGWSVQYSAFSDTTWTVNGFVGGIQPGGYFLIQMGNASANGQPMPPANAYFNTWLYPSGGKVALVASGASSTNCPSATAMPLVDLVGYGATQCWEGSGPAPGMTPAVALFRMQQGCQDTDDNANDHVTGIAAPRNGSSPPVSCGSVITAQGLATPAIIPASNPTLFTVTVVPAPSPPSTGITVTADLSAIGGLAAQPLVDDGTNGDVTPGDNVFSLSYTTQLDALPASHNIPFAVVDAEARSTTGSLLLQIVAPVVVSQVYTPGGGGAGSQGYNNSYVELHNRGPHPADLSGWTVQCNSGGGGVWETTPLNGIIPAGGYYMVQESNPVPVGQPLPSPDAVGPSWLFPSNGRVAVVASATAGTGCLEDVPVLDRVSYGGMSCYEGSGSAPNLSPFMAGHRRFQGCQDTDNNAADFVVTNPVPRNSSTPPVSCAPAGAPGASQPAVGPGYPVLITLTLTPFPPGEPALAAAEVLVSADLTALGMGTVPMVDDGTGGDQTASDNVYSYFVTVPPGTPPGNKPIPITACREGVCDESVLNLQVAVPTGVGDAPLAFALGGAEPNPTVGAFALHFVLPNAGAARLSLLDVAGRRVASVDVGRMGAGRHVVRFGDQTRLAPGVYLARLTQGGRTATTRVIVR